MDARVSRRQKRLSRQQEKRAAADLGGRVQAASGATRHGGGADVRVAGQTRVECKYTEAISYTLRLSELNKLRKQAMQALEAPAFLFKFQGSNLSYVVVPASDTQDANRFTTSRQMNFHEWGLTQYFYSSIRADSPKVMRLVFCDKKTDQRQAFDLMTWDHFLSQQELPDA